MQHKLIVSTLAFAALVAGTSLAHAQAANYSPVRADVGFAGHSQPAVGRFGFGGQGEVKFNIHDQIAIGVRLDGAILLGGDIGEDGGTSVSVGVVGGTLLKGEYFLTTSSVRPFLGLAAGLYDIVSQEVTGGPDTTYVDQKAGRYFGVGPQLGINLGPVRLAAMYNMILGADIEVRQTVGGAERSSTYSQSYFTFEMSFQIGGKRKPPPAPALPPGGYYNPTGPYMPPPASPPPAQ